MSVSATTALAVGGAISQGAGAVADTINSGLQAHYNRELTREENAKNRDFTHQENLLAREWQERMSNTAYQRTVADLEKAGLNKMLAYGANPANMTASSGGSNSSISASGLSGNSSFKDIGYGLVESAKLTARQADLDVKQQSQDLRVAKFNEKIAERNQEEITQRNRIYLGNGEFVEHTNKYYQDR